MLRNYYLTAIRNLMKHKGYFLLNMSGLAIGISSFIFILLFVLNELSYDRFHHNAENIYRAQVKGQMMGQSLNMAVSAAPMSKALKDEYPEVTAVTRVKESGAWFIGNGEVKFNEDGVLFADSTFFDVFSFKLLSGDPKTALKEPKSFVITESTAKKYFGEEDPLGKFLTVENDTIFYKITGIMQDIPDNSHIKFDFLGSFITYPGWDNQQWVSHNQYTYLVLADGSDVAHFERKIQELVDKYVGPQIAQFLGTTMEDWEKSGNSFGYYLMPLTDIHLHSDVEGELEANSHMSYIYIYSLISCVLLFIGIINFVNLATAQSSSRAKEVGVRKVLGSSKSNLIPQFIFESVMVALIATAVAAMVVVSLTPAFEQLIQKQLAYNLSSSYLSYFLLTALGILIGLVAGFYPAIVLASFQPVEVLKGKLKAGTKSGMLRNMLVIGQFAASIIIIIGTLVVYQQVNYMLTKNLGFDKEQILVVRRPDVLRKNIETYKQEILSIPGVKAAANASSIPGKSGYSNNAHLAEDRPDIPYLLQENFVSFGYAELMGLELVQGRLFSKDFSSDSSAALINETAAKMLGWEDPIGKGFLNKNEENGEKIRIIGVVKDYNIKSLHTPMEPVMLRLMPGNWEGYLTIRLENTHNIRETISALENSWYKYSYNKPFQYFFFDEDYAKLYKSESTTGQVFLIFAGLSIFIACLGLIGLITFTTAVRRKEIGIRKVMGAGTSSLVILLSSEFLKLIGIATLISWPLAYFASRYWLQNFADRLSISPWFFLLSTLVVLLMGAVAISFQTVKTSLMNPTESLRQD